MQVEVIAPQRLDPALRDKWNAIQSNHPTLDSPFFCAAFSRAVGQARAGVEVAVIEGDGGALGFFPYFRTERNVARPIAGTFTDFQGMVLAGDAAIDPAEVLQRCRLRSWQFDHLIADQTAFQSLHSAYSESPYLDLSGGFEAYRVERREAGSDELREALRKSRKIQRDVAPLTFEAATVDTTVLKTLVDWKRQQLRARKLRDRLNPDWVMPMLEQLLHTRDDCFQSMLSALYVGDDLLAVNYGLRSGEVLHGWITAFNVKYRKFSPGLILLTRLAQMAESHGITRIDMGRGDESFKKSFGSGSRMLAEGTVDRRIVAGSVRRNWIRTKELIRHTPLAAPARRLVTALRYAGSRNRLAPRTEDTV